MPTAARLGHDCNFVQRRNRGLAAVGKKFVVTIVVTFVVVGFVVAFVVPFVVVAVVTIVVPFVVPFVVEFVVAATEIRPHRKVIPWF